jgi:hypothetical protein
MNERELVIKYLSGVSKLENYYLKRGKEMDEYISLWKNIEKYDEVEKLRYIFNNEPKKMIKYISIIDCINDILISHAINDKKLINLEISEKGVFFKNYIEIFTEYNRSDYLNDVELSKDSKELARIYFDLKDIEGELYYWLKKTQRKVKFLDLTSM